MILAHFQELLLAVVLLLWAQPKIGPGSLALQLHSLEFRVLRGFLLFFFREAASRWASVFGFAVSVVLLSLLLRHLLCRIRHSRAHDYDATFFTLVFSAH